MQKEDTEMAFGNTSTVWENNECAIISYKLLIH